MSTIAEPNITADTEIIYITPKERAREAALRKHFAEFWGSTIGSPREVYDAFISASPLTDDVTLAPVEEKGVAGWWVRPQAARAAKAILFIHGGGYGLGSAKAYRGFASQIASRTQVPVLAIDYPLAPEASLPAAPDAALRAWQLLLDQGYRQIAIVGESAGGGLALVTMTQLGKDKSGIAPVAGVVFSPWADLAFTGASMTDPTVEDPLISHDYLLHSARSYLGGRAPSDPQASALFGDLEGLPPLLIQVGTDERLLDDSRQFAERAAKAGATVKLEIWEGMHHVFQLDVAHLESSRTALDRAAQFLSAAFGA